ncbi:MAG: molecular chaperone DnaJ [Thermodesulfobacteriota bacterium]
MEDRDYYEILGVSREADDADIKRAYRKLAHQHHPDKKQGDKDAEERFKAINEAYAVLKDPEKRAQYDRFGRSGAGVGQGDFGFGVDFQDFFSDVFSEFFGGGGGGRGRGRPRAERGRDLRYDMEIEFEEAAFGTDRKIKIPRTVQCSACSGSGAKPGTMPTTCVTCGGSGQMKLQQGFLSISRPCSSCGGAGSVIESPCGECAGSGHIKTASTLTVKIPHGVDTGSRLRIAGEGEHGTLGGPAGDLYIFISVKPHPIFTRQQDDVVCEVPISFPQAALGSEIEAPTIEGPVKLKVPAGTQTGKSFRLRGKGIASSATGRRGDQHVIVNIETPSKLNSRQKELLREFAKLGGDETMPNKKNFLEKVRELFE